MNKEKIIDLLIDIEGELHFRLPQSSKIQEIRALVMLLKKSSGEEDDQHAIILEFYSLLKSELIFSGVEHDHRLIKRIKAMNGKQQLLNKKKSHKQSIQDE